jgi:hypothetical protein
MTKHKKENSKKIKDTIKPKKDKTSATIPFVYHKEETIIEAIQKKALPDLIPLVLRTPTVPSDLVLEEKIEIEEQLFCEEVEEKGKEVEKVKEVEKETIESILNLPMPSEFTLVSPTSNHTNEQKLERFIRLRKGPTPNKVNYYEFMGSGVSMATIGHIGEFYVGKFKLVRKYVSEDWTITIEDKIKK